MWILSDFINGCPALPLELLLSLVPQESSATSLRFLCLTVLQTIGRVLQVCNYVCNRGRCSSPLSCAPVACSRLPSGPSGRTGASLGPRTKYTDLPFNGRSVCFVCMLTKCNFHLLNPFRHYRRHIVPAVMPKCVKKVVVILCPCPDMGPGMRQQFDPHRSQRPVREHMFPKWHKGSARESSWYYFATVQ